MNKEELEKEAGEYADKHAFRVPYDGTYKFYDDVDFKASKEGYLAGAEPREKHNAYLELKIKYLTRHLEPQAMSALFEQVEEEVKQEQRIEELEAQIEKMKCCENCAWWYKLPNGQRDCAETCENLDNWSLRR